MMNEKLYNQVVVNPGTNGQLWDSGDDFMTLSEWRAHVERKEAMKVWKVVPLRTEVEYSDEDLQE